MTKREKRITSMRRNPKSVRPDDLDVVLREEGFSVRQQSTSHRIYVRGSQQISVPQRHPFLLPVYVRQALALIGEAEEVEEDSHGSSTES